MSKKIKLGPPPNKKTAKMSFVMPEEELKRLSDYAALYNATYETALKPGEILPQIVASFLDGDAAYRQWAARQT